MKRISNARNEYTIPYKFGTRKGVKCTKLDYLLERNFYCTRPLNNKERKELKELLFWFKLKHNVAKTYLKWTKRDDHIYEHLDGSLHKIHCSYLSYLFFKYQYGISLNKRECRIFKHLSRVEEIYKTNIK